MPPPISINDHPNLMPPVQAIIAKELRSYFVSPIVYVVGGVFLLTFGFLAYLYIVFTGAQAIQLMQMQGGAAQINLNDLVFRNLFASMRFVLLLVLPILTMRLLAEERKLRTFEFLMTAPVRISDIIVGKFVMLLLTMLVPLTLALFSDFDWYPVMTGYLGLALLGGLFLSVGLFASSITENQIVAAFTSFGLLLMCWLLAGLGSLLGDTSAGHIVSYLSFMEHFDHLVRGLIDTKDLIYYVSGTGLMLFLAHRIVDSSRWR
jgi:ABC-2 type transport system permease protein